MLNYIENTMTMSMEKESRGLRLDHYGSIEKGKSQAKGRGKRNQVNGFFFLQLIQSNLRYTLTH